MLMPKKKPTADKTAKTEKSVEQLREEFFARERAAYDERMKPTKAEAEKSDETTTDETDESESETETQTNEESEGDK